MTHETQHGGGDAAKDFQPLTARQRETLDFLLSTWIHRVAEWAPYDAGLRMTS